MRHAQRLSVLLPLVLALALPLGTWTVQAHGPSRADGNDIQFGQLGVEDADTARKVEPRKLTIKVGETVTFHVNGGHQVVILKPGVALEDLGSEGVNLDGTGPQTPLPPQVYPNAVAATTGLGPRLGPGRWDANPAGLCPAEPANIAEAANSDRPQVFDKQDCATPNVAATTDFTTRAFTSPGRYAYFCNFPIHSWDEGIAVTDPGNVDQPVIINAFGMHGFIYVEP